MSYGFQMFVFSDSKSYPTGNRTYFVGRASDKLCY